ncbi:MAG: hypothetical protein WAS21_18700 [Geminicoccaceae bacterium]
MAISIANGSNVSRYLIGTAALGIWTLLSVEAHAASEATFAMKRSTGLPATCAPGAKATVKIQTLGFAEKMTVTVSGLRPNTALDLFTIQVPNFPFGLGWYVGDLEAGYDGKVTKTFISRFSVETFAVAIGQAAAPVKHPGDANTNPTFKPIHTLHLGAWFNSPADAARNGCATVLTPFNGEHNAGIQVLSTNGFADLKGPLGKID